MPKWDKFCKGRIRRGYSLFNLEKLIQACNYLLKKNNYSLNYTKLIKLLYLADKESLKGAIQTISGDTYVSMDNGPVLSKQAVCPDYGQV